MHISILYITVTVITQPTNVSGCVGGTAMFTCVMRFENVSVNEEGIKWWRRRNDQPTKKLKIIETQGNKFFSITSNISGETLTSVLMINVLRSTLIGPYWLEMADDTQLSDVAFLSIAPSGMCVRIYAFCTCVYIHSFI